MRNKQGNIYISTKQDTWHTVDSIWETSNRNNRNHCNHMNNAWCLYRNSQCTKGFSRHFMFKTTNEAVIILRILAFGTDKKKSCKKCHHLPNVTWIADWWG